MYLTREIQLRFQKDYETPLINYEKFLPDTTRVITSDNVLATIWKKAQSKIPSGELSSMRKRISNKLYKRVGNFDMLIKGKRTPTLRLFRLIKKNMSTYGIHIDLQKILNNARIKFGEGGNAASAKLPNYLSPKLAYIIGAMRDGTLARSGKYEISISQREIFWLVILKELIENIFQPSNALAIRNNRVTLSNRPMFEYLNKIFDIPIGKKDKWSTPKIIKKVSPNLQRYYIRGFFDADGLRYKLGFCQVNKEALLFVKNTLEKLNIKTGKVSARKGKKQVLYTFNTSTKSHKDFIKIIGSLNPSKQRLFLLHNKTS